MPLNISSYNVLFLSQDALVSNGVIDENVDPKIIMPVIKLVQDQWLQELIGTNLMVDLQNKVSSGSLNSNETGLLKMYIEPYMIYMCTYELATFNTYKVKVKGLQKMSGENSQPASLSEIQSFKDEARNNAGFYAQRLVRYLESNNLFPAYLQAGSTIADMVPIKRGGYQSSMYLGNTGYSNQNGSRRGNYYDYWFGPDGY